MARTADRPRTATPLSAGERKRLDALLKVAAESPYPGERANALDAARRLAGRHGVSVKDAAGQRCGAPPAVHARRRADRSGAQDIAEFFAYSEARLRAERERYERALREAMERGLDNGARPRAANRERAGGTQPVGRGRSPHSFARVLLSETSLPLREIVSLTGLDIYRVVGLKLKMRSTA